MNKKIIVLLIIIIVLISIIVLLGNKKTEQNEEVENSEIYKDEFGSNYNVIYNEDSFVYEIYDNSGRMLFVTPNKDDIQNHLNNVIDEDVNNQYGDEQALTLP